MTIESGTLEFSACSPNQPEWPKLTCSNPNELDLQDGDLLLEGGRALRFQGDGYIDAGGSFGIGTSMPAHALDVNGDVSAANFLKNGSPMVSSQWDDATNGVNFSGGNVGIGTPNPGQRLDVGGAVNATDFLKNGASLVESKWDDATGGINFSGGNVGIGTPNPGQRLDVAGAVNATDFLKNGAPLAGSKWDGAANGINFSGGNVGIGVPNPQERLEVNGALRFNANSSQKISGETRATHNAIVLKGNWSELEVKGRVIDWTGSNLHIGFANNHANDFIEIGRKVGHISLMSGGGTTERMRIAKNGNVGIGQDREKPEAKLDVNGSLKINGSLSLPHSGGSSASFTNRKYDNENELFGNNIKLTMTSTGPFFTFPTLPPVYEFAVGHTENSLGHISIPGPITGPGPVTGPFPGPVTGPVLNSKFIKKFSINSNGKLYAAAGKVGFVIDYFVNQVGERLEQGDVVVIGEQTTTHFTGTNNSIPIHEVDLAQDAYDTRVCGIVDGAVTERDLPLVETKAPELTPEEQKEIERMLENGDIPVGTDAEYAHPLKEYAAEFNEDYDLSTIQDKRMGQMVTLGAYAHCKVDADIAPIVPGDLLTTSPTRGHAQKVLDRQQALGAVVGKALAGLDKGKGKIPILVMLH